MDYNGFPEKSDTFYLGQDLMFTQFNDVNFYIEDQDQENLYFEILKTQFPNVTFSKIFPLNGKKNVITEAKANLSTKNNIYIVDKDFDDILNKKETVANLFYLNQYSIENHLFDEAAINSIVIEEKPKIKREELIDKFKYNEFLDEANTLYKDLISHFLVIQEHDLEIKNVKCNPEKFCTFNPTSSLKTQDFNSLKDEINTLLTVKSSTLILENEKVKYDQHLGSTTNIPGKYILKFLKSRLTSLFQIQINWDSFVIRMAKLCDLNSLEYLKIPIVQRLK
jgi:hypothetical protein